MTRDEILTRFRQENPEVTINVASDSVLESWCEIGNLEICTRVRLIKGSGSFSAVADIDTYNLAAQISKFYDIDELPGGGVAYNDKRLKFTTKAALDESKPGWRTATSGTPTEYFRRGTNIIFNRPPDGTDTIDVDAILIPDAFDDGSKTPYNQLSYLEPFHYALVLYLKMRVFAGKIKKKDSEMTAHQEFEVYVKWMKEEVNRGIYKAIRLEPPSGYRGTSRYNR